MSKVELSPLFLYNNNTLIDIVGEELGFITIVPLKNIENMKYADEIELEKYNNIKKLLINGMAIFDKGSGILAKPNLGASYKIISYYKKFDPLQTYQLKKNTELFEKIIERKDLSYDPNSFEYFMETKKRTKINMILEQKYYTKEDYLVCKTIFPKHLYEERLGIEKKEAFSKTMKNLTKEIYLKRFKNGFELLNIEHSKNYSKIEKEIGSRDFAVNSGNILDILLKLNLGAPLTNLYDLNFVNNNLNNKYRDIGLKKVDIYFNKEESIKKSYYVKADHVVFENNGQKKVKKIYEDEYVDIYEDNNVIKTQKNRLESGFEIKEELFPPIMDYHHYKIEDYKNEYKYYMLDEPPEIFDEKLAEKLSDVLKDEDLEEFILSLDLIKYDVKTLKKELKSKENAYEAISSIWNAPGWFYDKQETYSRISAYKSMRNHIEDGKNFFNIKYSIAIKNETFDKNFDFLIEQKFKDLNFKVSKLDYNLTKIVYPYSYNKFILVTEKQIELELEDLLTLINLKYSTTYFSGRNDRSLLDLEKIDDACIYVHTDDKVQGLHIFDGPDKFNGLIIASSGSGKSFLAVNLIDGFMNSKRNMAWILDRGGSYISYTTAKGGKNVNINQASGKNCINPFNFDVYFGIQVYMENYLHQYLNNKENNTMGSEDELFEKMYSILILREGDRVNFFKEDVKKLNAQKEITINYSNMIDVNDEIDNLEFESTIPQVKIDIYKSILTSMMELDEKKHVEFHILETQIINLVVEEIIEKTKQHVFEWYKDKVFLEMVLKLQSYDCKDEKEALDIMEKIMLKQGEGLYLKLDILKEKLENKIIPLIKSNPKEYTEALEKYININQYGKIFNGKPNISMDSTLINIDFGEIQDPKISNIVFTAILMNFFAVMTNPLYRSSKKLLLIDEAHAILNAESLVGLKGISYLYRTTRKHGAACFLLSQDISDFKKEVGDDPVRKNLFDGIFGNAGWIFLLGTHLVSKLQRAFELPKDVAGDIEKYDKSVRKFFVISDMVKKFCRLIVSDLDYWTATTNKEEKNMLVTIKKLTGSSSFALSVCSNVFKSSFLSTYNSVLNLISLKCGSVEYNQSGFEKVKERLRLQNYIVDMRVLKKLTELELKALASILTIMEEQEYKGFSNAPIRNLFIEIEE
jgi:hypothetical protein